MPITMFEVIQVVIGTASGIPRNKYYEDRIKDSRDYPAPIRPLLYNGFMVPEQCFQS
jgi:hypothetical protein